VIRPATPDDVPVILDLIRALAVYEREPDVVEATEALLAEALFGPTPAVFAHLACTSDGAVVGLALWYVTFSTWLGRHGVWLEDLFVEPSHRGEGHGLALLHSLASVCVERGYGRLEWNVLDWNEPALRFYRALGAEPLDEWTVQRLSGEALVRLGSAAGTS
jgi:GNAT superfamily N-acetyltransferase